MRYSSALYGVFQGGDYVCLPDHVFKPSRSPSSCDDCIAHTITGVPDGRKTRNDCSIDASMTQKLPLFGIQPTRTRPLETGRTRHSKFHTAFTIRPGNLRHTEKPLPLLPSGPDGVCNLHVAQGPATLKSLSYAHDKSESNGGERGI